MCVYMCVAWTRPNQRQCHLTATDPYAEMGCRLSFSAVVTPHAVLHCRIYTNGLAGG